MNKPFEVHTIRYSFGKYTRKLVNEPKWRRYRGYKTMEAADDAIKAKRRDILDKSYYHYPGEEVESKYPHIKPTINIYRYKIESLFPLK